jgi:hypothetical protein
MIKNYKENPGFMNILEVLVVIIQVEKGDDPNFSTTVSTC